MASIDYPSSLPQSMNEDGYSHSGGDNLLRSQPDAGPAKQRRRFTGVPQPVTGVIQVTDAEYAIFWNWYRNDLLNGALRFNWVDQADGATAVEMRFVEAPTDKRTGPGHWSITLNLEIMP